MQKSVGRIFQKTDKELSQAIARSSVTSLIIIIDLILDLFTSQTYIVLMSYALYTLANIAWVYLKPGNYPLRRVLNIVGDAAIIGFVLYHAPKTAIVLYPVLLWVIIGNGIRFGIRYLFIALGVSELFFIAALLNNPAWETEKAFVISLSAGLAAISIFAAKLIQRLHMLNETLEKKVKARVEEVEHRYLHDTLTDLKNRRALDRDLRKNVFGGIIVVNIDQFRNYNDLYGMAGGDEVLRQMARFLRIFGETNGYEVYRVYSDHFVLRNLSGRIVHAKYEADIDALFSQLENFKITLPEIEDELELEITVGISLEGENALKKAEMALAYAKQKKMPCIAYSRMVDSSTLSHELLHWRKEIKKAIVTDNIVPVFQPLFDRDGNIVKYEALMRLRRVNDGKIEMVSPVFFLEIAHKSKQYEKLTEIMIDKSFRFATQVPKDISINLSFEDIVNVRIKEKLKSQIHKYGIAKQMIFEIVESTDIEDFKQVKAFIAEFQKMGVRIAVDDFGSGYSNFTHILELAPDYLKIDGSLVKHIDTDEKSHILVRAITSMAQEFGIKTIAEFVSKKEIFDICYELGIDYFQGYYFSEPLQEEEIKDQSSGGQGGIRTLGSLTTTHP